MYEQQIKNNGGEAALTGEDRKNRTQFRERMKNIFNIENPLENADNPDYLGQILGNEKIVTKDLQELVNIVEKRTLPGWFT